MLSAAGLIAERHPEDSVCVTRRAVEVAEAALAFKLNDANASQWAAYEERHARWLKRQAAEKPRPFHVQYRDIIGDPLMDEIKRWLGVLSDAYVHFTPELYNSLDWDVQMRPEGDGKIFLHSFQRNDQEIQRHFNTLAAVHLTILKAFDRCFDMGISGDATKIAAVDAFKATAKRFNDEYQERYAAKSHNETNLVEEQPLQLVANRRDDSFCVAPRVRHGALGPVWI